MDNIKIAKILLRLGIAFVFIYAAISMSLDPQSYAHYLPEPLRQIFPVETLLHLFGGFEIIFSIWLLWGKWNIFPALIATVTIFGLTVINLDSFNVLFRNVAIFTACLALVMLDLDKS